eukprot:142481-Chlamydomonas_euryale.AAC.2
MQRSDPCSALILAGGGLLKAARACLVLAMLCPAVPVASAVPCADCNFPACLWLPCHASGHRSLDQHPQFCSLGPDARLGVLFQALLATLPSSLLQLCL